MKRKRRKKLHKKQIHRDSTRLLSAAGVLIVCIIVAAGVLIGRISQKGEESSGRAETETKLSGEDEAVSEQEEMPLYGPQGESGPEVPAAVPEAAAEPDGTTAEQTSESELPKDEGALGSEPGDTLSAEAAEAPDDMAKEETAAGTILAADQLDLTDLSRYFTAVPIEAGDPVYNRINGRSWRENEHIALSDLRYLKLLHYNFSGQVQVGEMIVNKSIADDVVSIFEELFACGYQIQSMYLIDNYWTGDPDDSDTASIDENNTSAFCYRPVTNGTKLSAHAYGKAIDLNPQQNPYVSYSSGSPRWYHENANDYIARDTGLPHVITHGDAAFLIFQKYGFFWGGDWNNPKDYQHFEKK